MGVETQYLSVNATNATPCHDATDERKQTVFGEILIYKVTAAAAAGKKFAWKNARRMGELL